MECVSALMDMVAPLAPSVCADQPTAMEMASAQEVAASATLGSMVAIVVSLSALTALVPIDTASTELVHVRTAGPEKTVKLLNARTTARVTESAMMAHAFATLAGPALIAQPRSAQDSRAAMLALAMGCVIP